MYGIKSYNKFLKCLTINEKINFILELPIINENEIKPEYILDIIDLNKSNINDIDIFDKIYKSEMICSYLLCKLNRFKTDKNNDLFDKFYYLH